MGKMKESEKRDKYLNLARFERKKVEHETDGALQAFSKGLEKRLRDLEIRSIEATALLKSARILKVLET